MTICATTSAAALYGLSLSNSNLSPLVGINFSASSLLPYPQNCPILALARPYQLLSTEINNSLLSRDRKPIRHAYDRYEQLYEKSQPASLLPKSSNSSSIESLSTRPETSLPAPTPNELGNNELGLEQAVGNLECEYVREM
ncbi:hypothetical protein BGZ63DRAFT_401308 [Mariannaea sp. PMI_226]|nr:hypothetical protein BGZ63DRAFT_401308 [Mariannaea sp. PMI_226]